MDKNPAESDRAGARLRVLVLDVNVRQGLAACRGLGRAGHEVGAAAYEPAPMAASSRYVSRYHQLPNPSEDGRIFGDALVDVVERWGYQAIVSSDDPTLARLDWLRLPFPTVPAPSPGFLAVTDKLVLAELAASVGVDYPATYVVDSPTALRSALAASGLPAVVKASRSATARPDRVLYSKGAAVVANEDEAVRACDALVTDGFTPILQTRVWSPSKVNAVVIRRDGYSAFRYAHRVLREIPSSGGIGITLEMVSPDDREAAASIEALERICDAASYQGLAQAEFYLDPSSGRAWLLDVNPRLWGSTWFVEKLGMQVVEQAVRDALGERNERPRRPYPVGRRFHHATTEFLWFREHKSVPRSIAAVLRNLGRGDVLEYVDPTDLRPFVSHVLRRFRQ